MYLYQVGNTSSNKNTEYKKLGPRLERKWVSIQGLYVYAVATNTVKSQERSYGTKYLYIDEKTNVVFSLFIGSLVCGRPQKIFQKNIYFILLMYISRECVAGPTVTAAEVLPSVLLMCKIFYSVSAHEQGRHLPFPLHV